MSENASSSRSIPSLDGLRAISVIAVILGHTESPFLDRIPFGAALRNGHQGVIVFFAISGFLITHLLLKELQHEGSINLGRFYLRRTFRIFPPFYVFLAVIAILRFSHVIASPAVGSAFLACGTYTWNYWHFPPEIDVRVLGHCWSLALEEQFYLLWPLCMKLFSPRTNIRIAVGVILLSPFSRLLTYALWPSRRGNIDMMLHTHLDAIMIGCLVALLVESKVWPQVWSRVRAIMVHPIAPVIAIAFLMFVDTPASEHWGGKYLLPIGFTLQSLAATVLLVFGVFRHESLFGKFLNWAPLRHIGTISYSLYLWQQLFTGAYTGLFPLNVLFIFLCAEASFFLVERPSARVRNIVQARLYPSRRVAAARQELKI